MCTSSWGSGCASVCSVGLQTSQSLLARWPIGLGFPDKDYRPGQVPLRQQRGGYSLWAWPTAEAFLAPACWMSTLSLS